MKKYQLQDPKVLVAEGKKRVIKISGGGAVPKHFELNLRLLFGTRDGVKNKSTNERCLALCNLPAMNLIRWAMEHPRTVWSGGRISDRIFRQLVKQTDGHIEVPPCVNEELVRLKSDCFSDNANFASMIHDFERSYRNSYIDEHNAIGTAEDPPISHAELADFLTFIRYFRVESFERDLLLLGIDAQYRWDESGNTRAIVVRDTQMSQKSIAFFKSQERLEEFLRLGVRNGLLRKGTEDQRCVYHIIRRTGETLDDEDPCIDSLIFLCHICPRDESFTERFFDIVKLLRPALTSWFEYLLERPAIFSESLLQDDLVHTCIALLKVTDFGSMQKAISILERLCGPAATLSSRMVVANAQSTMLRRKEQYADSDRILQNAISNTKDDTVYHVYLSGQLYLSLVENSILRNDHATALKWLDKINLPAQGSPGQVPVLMWRLFERKWTTMGRIYRFTGCFREAKDVLEPCIGAHQNLPAHNVINIVRQLADVLIELGESDNAMGLLDYHLKLLQQEGKEESKFCNKLLLSYADAELRMGRYESAQARLNDIRKWFDVRSPSNQTDQLDHVRTLMVHMRIFVYQGQWPEVLEWSTKALQLADQYTCFTANNHYKGYIRKVRAISLLNLAQADMDAASKCVQEPRHYMTGIGTYDKVKAHTELCNALGSCTAFDLTLLGIEEC